MTIDKSVFRKYQELGFNLVPLGNDKRPAAVGELANGEPWRFSWREWHNESQPEDYWLVLSCEEWWQGVEGVAAICGEVSGGLVCIDFDSADDGPNVDAAHVDAALYALGVPNSVWVVKTPGGGFHVWLRSDIDISKRKLDAPAVSETVDHIELRMQAHMTTLPPSSHPDGGHYAWTGVVPTEAPPFVDGEKLLGVYKSLVVFPEVKTSEFVGGPVTIQAGNEYTTGKEVSPRYVSVAIDNIISDLQGAANGGRNHALNKAAFAMGQLVGDNLIDQTEAENILTEAGLSLGLDEVEIGKTIRSGFGSGATESRGLVLKPFVPTYRTQNVDLEDGVAISIPWGQSSQWDLYDVMPEDGGIMDKWLNEYGHQWLFVVGHDHWLSWAESHWRKDAALTIQKELQGFVKEMNAESVEKLTAAEEEGEKFAIRKARQYITATTRTSGRINSVIKMATAHKAVNVDHLNGDGNLLNLLNCTINLDTYEPQDHSPTDLITHCLDFNYDDEATCPRWEQFLREVIVHEGTLDHDTDVIELLRELMGYSLTSETSHEVMAWFQGEGSNGKTVAISIISALLGSLSMSVNFHKIGTSGNYELADIAGKRILFSTESERGQPIQEGVIKNIVSGERINARPIYGSPFEFKPVSKIFWAANNLPVIRDTSESIWRRLKLIAFHRKFEESEKDVHLTDALMLELPGILNWALMGLYTLRERKRFLTPAASRAAVEQLKLDTNPIARWLAECTEMTIDISTPMTEIYQSYRDWCASNGNTGVASSNNLGIELKRSGVPKKMSNGPKYALRIKTPIVGL
jgi:P4 family phage/plasmid primase-like protien